MTTDFAAAAADLTDFLGLSAAPLAISFHDQPVDGVDAYGEDYPAATEGSRTGAVSAGCVFWIKATERTFSTVAADHGNCSVGSLTHGFRTLDEVAGNEDVGALVGAEWVSPEIFPQIPVVKDKPEAVVYGPLADAPVAPDIVFIRLNGKQAMMLHDACPEIQFEGKPQCHVIPIAKDQGKIALSLGCMLSRVRTGMSNNEMTCAIPAAKVAEVIAALRTAAAADRKVAAYAAQDAQRFS
ncbi:MAG: DUF169 domain-containing protein [Alphaproteobacteria bacterium]